MLILKKMHILKMYFSEDLKKYFSYKPKENFVELLSIHEN